jgi:hypothetical protein
MAKSKLKTNLAILRADLGEMGKIKPFCKLIKSSESWVKKASAGIIPVLPPTAWEISILTGYDIDWIQGTGNKKISKRGKKKNIDYLVRRYRESLYEQYGVSK